ncbi:MAG: hypothetical protein IIA85_01870 [Nanoarchaeota archaeon]|nr:hypothetical protein [Nanoarchaeota archaeon]
MKNILFICKHNVFRSNTAEAYFKKINENKNIKASSAGFIKGDWFGKRAKEVINSQRKALKKKGINIKSKSKTLSIKLLKKQNLIIIISNDLSNIFNENYMKQDSKIRIWKIKDVTSKNYSEKNLIKAIDSIMKKVDDLVKELK